MGQPASLGEGAVMMLIIAAIAFYSGLRYQKETLDESKKPQPPAEWVALASLTGNETATTKTFESYGEFRIQWAATAAAAASQFSINVYDAETGSVAAIPVLTRRSDRDLTLVQLRPGRFYLRIEATNVSWSVRVEERQ
jgi:hypothetical protein